MENKLIEVSKYLETELKDYLSFFKINIKKLDNRFEIYYLIKKDYILITIFNNNEIKIQSNEYLYKIKYNELFEIHITNLLKNIITKILNINLSKKKLKEFNEVIKNMEIQKQNEMINLDINKFNKNDIKYLINNINNIPHIKNNIKIYFLVNINNDEDYDLYNDNEIEEYEYMLNIIVGGNYGNNQIILKLNPKIDILNNQFIDNQFLINVDEINYYYFFIFNNSIDIFKIDKKSDDEIDYEFIENIKIHESINKIIEYSIKLLLIDNINNKNININDLINIKTINLK